MKHHVTWSKFATHTFAYTMFCREIATADSDVIKDNDHMLFCVVVLFASSLQSGPRWYTTPFLSLLDSTAVLQTLRVNFGAT